MIFTTLQIFTFAPSISICLEIPSNLFSVLERTSIKATTPEQLSKSTLLDKLFFLQTPCLHADVVVNFFSQVIFVFLLFLSMVMYVNEVETKEK